MVSSAGYCIALLAVIAAVKCQPDVIPPPPLPERIAVTELPLPPTAPSPINGSCTAAVNPNGTGCLAQNGTFQSGSFLWDGKHVVAVATYGGAPTSGPESIYTGEQIIIVKTDGTKFSNGDPWKCITCGVPAVNRVGMNDEYGYPQTFKDGSRLLIGTNILDCGDAQLVDDDCTPDTTYVYPLRFNTAADGSGAGASIRELRLHPDQVHLEFSSFSMTAGSIDELAYFGRLQFNPAPTSGTPLGPRYDIINVTTLFNPDGLQPITVSGHQLHVNREAISVGEARGFSGDGTELIYVGFPAESCNVDVFVADLTTGAVRRLTQHPEYCDPVDFSPDNKWMAIMDTRGSGRDMFMSGMRYVPPLIDLVVMTIAASVRNNGDRRFFEPYLLDHWGDRGTYFGQKISGGSNGTPGSGAADDPEWNGQADPRWSPDSTQLVFGQRQTVSPACGGANPLACYLSYEPGGRTFRMMLATFVDRAPTEPLHVAERPDAVPWGVPYVAGSPAPARTQPPTGVYTLKGRFSGIALVNITQPSAGVAGSVGVAYVDYSDDGRNFLNGAEYAEGGVRNYTVAYASWWSELVMYGPTKATKKTSLDGFHVSIDVLTNIFEANGSLTTVVNGTTWSQPLNGA